MGLTFPTEAKVRKTGAVIAVLDHLDEMAQAIGTGRELLHDMPVIDGEQQRLMTELDHRLADAVEAFKALDYRMEVFKEKGVI